MRSLIVAAAMFVSMAPAFAQRADDNALAEAQDAFGTTVGIETIGLYAPDEVRGFSALDAGNERLDGLYFDLQTPLTDHLIDSTAMRVGISSQGYPLPAPTGIVDYRLRRPGDRRVISTLVGYGAFDGHLVSVDTQWPLLEKKLSLGIGASLAENEYEYGAGEQAKAATVIARWRATDRVEVVPFWDRQVLDTDGPLPILSTAGAYLPRKYRRGAYYGQSWTGALSTGDTLGVLVDAVLGDDWLFKGGIFRSTLDSDHSFSELYLDAQPDNTALYSVVAYPGQRFTSTSGEARLVRRFKSEAVQQSLQVTVRSRERQRRYGGADVLDFGSARIGEPHPVAMPEIVFEPQARDHVQQTTVGFAYDARWPGRAQLSLGLQRARYRKEVTLPSPGETTRGRDDPTLFNAGGSVHVSPKLSFYASYSRGLEEGGVAPRSAVNRDTAPPAIRTQQKDGGVQYALSPEVQIIAGLFEIQKPYYSVDSLGFYRQLGDQRHRGVELSVSGQMAGRASVAVGAVLMKPRVEGELVESGVIGERPVGQTSRSVSVNGEYRFSCLHGFSIDTDIVSYGPRVASSDNRLMIPSRTVVGIGARQRFKLLRADATLRVHVGNVFNNFGWRTDASGVLTPNAQRSFYANIAADF
jgi:iron complex outermembrane receptor protein